MRENKNGASKRQYSCSCVCLMFSLTVWTEGREHHIATAEQHNTMLMMLSVLCISLSWGYITNIVPDYIHSSVMDVATLQFLKQADLIVGEESRELSGGADSQAGFRPVVWFFSFLIWMYAGISVDFVNKQYPYKHKCSAKCALMQPQYASIMYLSLTFSLLTKWLYIAQPTNCLILRPRVYKAL